jgi:hypothetical protein
MRAGGRFESPRRGLTARRPPGALPHQAVLTCLASVSNAHAIAVFGRPGRPRRREHLARGTRCAGVAGARGRHRLTRPRPLPFFVSPSKGVRGQPHPAMMEARCRLQGIFSAARLHWKPDDAQRHKRHVEHPACRLCFPGGQVGAGPPPRGHHRAASAQARGRTPQRDTVGTRPCPGALLDSSWRGRPWWRRGRKWGAVRTPS